MAAERVVVFIDYENMHRCAAAEFNVTNGHFEPWALGELLVSRRNDRVGAAPCVLHEVRVYRGLPDSRRQPRANAANQAQSAAWKAAAPRPSDLVLYQRPLRYPSGWPNGGGSPQEKGVDVALAVDLVKLTYQGGFNVAIVCSHDTDLAPALDAAAAVQTGAHLEVASWARGRRISFTGTPNWPWCHRLKIADFTAVRDTRRY